MTDRQQGRKGLSLQSHQTMQREVQQEAPQQQAEQQQLTQEEPAPFHGMLCPAEWHRMHTSPHLCKNFIGYTDQRLATCNWNTEAPNCAGSCVCDPPNANTNLFSMEVCTRMCENHYPCVFTYFANKGCRVYSLCEETLIA